MKYFKKFLPRSETLQNSQSLGWLKKWLYSHPQLWHFNRHSVARGLGVGVFSAILPIPFQMLLAAILAILVRGNIPVAVLATWLTNPFTMIPVIYLIYKTGALITGETHAADQAFKAFHFDHSLFAMNMQDLQIVAVNLKIWLLSLGKNFFIGLPIVAIVLAAAAYFFVYISWYIYISVKIRARRMKSKRKSS